MNDSIVDADAAASAAEKQRGRPFQPGQSGNPAGRAAGSRNKATLAVEALLDGEAEQLTRKLIEKALEGDLAALKITMDRLLPPRRSRPLGMQLPPLTSAADGLAALAALADGLVQGEVGEGEARALVATVTAFQQTLQLSQLEERMASIENDIKALTHDSAKAAEPPRGR